jgi:hypothetical protein
MYYMGFSEDSGQKESSEKAEAIMKGHLITAILDKRQFCWVGVDMDYSFLYTLWLYYNS